MSDEKNAGGKPTDAKATADQQAVGAAWDRVGSYMESAQSIWDRMARRNFDLWKDVSGSLRSGPVTADSLAANSARAMAVAQETMEDLWTSLVDPARREVYVQVLPTAFLFIDRLTDPSDADKQRYAAVDPVHIPVDPRRKGDLPATAEIALNGSPLTPGGDPAKAVTALVARLRVTRQGASRNYLLETVTAGVPTELIPGTYDGLIYLTEPPFPLANLRIVVEGPPPVVDPAT